MVDRVMGDYPILCSFTAILFMLIERLVFLFIQQIYTESLICAQHVLGS